MQKKKAHKIKYVDKTQKKKKSRAFLLGRFDLLNRFRHWWLGGISLSRSLFRTTAAWQTIGLLSALLGTGFIMAAFYTGSGEFVISLDRPMVEDGFIMADNKTFDNSLVTLHGKAVADADNISIYDISRDVNDVDGSHNGINYVAYTFYLKNATGEEKSYQYQIQIKACEKGAENATWIMVFQNDKQEIYANKRENGEPECQYSYSDFPFSKYARNYKKQVTSLSDEEPGYITRDVMNYFDIDSVNGLFQLETIPFQSKDVVCTGIRESMKDSDVDKYTVVIWLEGEDPECVDDILGGYVELAMKISY